MPVRGDKPAPPMSLDTYRLLRLGEDLADTEHRCGRCANNPFMKSMVKCPNDTGNHDDHR